MKKKIVAALAALAALAVVSTGCSDSQGETMFGEIDIKGEQSSFGLIEEYNGFDIVYDKETGVMYTMSNRAYAYGILTPLLNSDGAPKIYQEEVRQ